MSEHHDIAELIEDHVLERVSDDQLETYSLPFPTDKSPRYLLLLQEVSYVINNEALLGPLDIQLPTSSLTVVLGANGAGKSLFLNLLHGLIEPTRGRLDWLDCDSGVIIPPPRQTMVFQTPVMLKRTVLENLAYVVKQKTKTDVYEKANQALKWAGLDKLAKKPAFYMSLGEQQQLAITRARLLSPEIMFLDEPTSNLDPEACRRIEGLISTMQEEGTNLIMTTHNLAQAKRLAQQVLFIHSGQIKAWQLANEFFTRPSCAEAKTFIQWEALGER